MFTFETQVIIFVVVVLAIVQFIVCKYQINSTIEHEINRNNRRLIKKMSEQIGLSFEQYMGLSLNKQPEKTNVQNEINKKIEQTKKNRDAIDSVDDPLDGDESED